MFLNSKAINFKDFQGLLPKDGMITSIYTRAGGFNGSEVNTRESKYTY